MKFLFITAFSFFLIQYSYAQDTDLELTPGQRASGVAKNDLKWNVYFNFPHCNNEGQKNGAWCLRRDANKAIKTNGVDDHLKSWITDPAVKSIYMSYFSFSNSSIAKALCYETSKRELNVQVYLDAGPGQTGAPGSTRGFYGNLERAEKSLIRAAAEGLIQSYNPGCIERIYNKMKKRGNGGCCDNGYFLQHSKIFMALEKKELFDKSEKLQEWLSDAGRVRFTSSSANMSSNGTAAHFENWLFFDAKAKDYVAVQNICSMWALGKTQFFDSSDENIAKQRDLFKSAYSDCWREKNSIETRRRRDMSFYMVPSYANNNGWGPSGAFSNMLYRYGRHGRKVRVAIHRLTSRAGRAPIIQAQKRGAKVTVLTDDDILRSSLVGAGSGLDVNYLDANSYRKLRRAGVNVRFVETNGGEQGFKHIFHNKFVIVGDKRLFQGAGNFTAKAFNAGGNDGSFEQFYVIKNKEIIQAYINGWEYLKKISSSRTEHPDGSKPDNCKKQNPNGGLALLVPCDTDGAEQY